MPNKVDDDNNDVNDNIVSLSVDVTACPHLPPRQPARRAARARPSGRSRPAASCPCASWRARSGVSHAAPRRHFADKQALLDALARGRVRAARRRSSRAALAGGRSTPAARVARAYVRFATEHAALLELMFAGKHALARASARPPSARFAPDARRIVAGQSWRARSCPARWRRSPPCSMVGPRSATEDARRALRRRRRSSGWPPAPSGRDGVMSGWSGTSRASSCGSGRWSAHAAAGRRAAAA